MRQNCFILCHPLISLKSQYLFHQILFYLYYTHGTAHCLLLFRTFNCCTSFSFWVINFSVLYRNVCRLFNLIALCYNVSLCLYFKVFILCIIPAHHFHVHLLSAFLISCSILKHNTHCNFHNYEFLLSCIWKWCILMFRRVF